MKLSSPAVVLPALCWSASAAVHVVSHPSTHRAHPASLDPVAARVVLAHRLGVEAYHSADLKSSETIDAINALGRRISLFGAKQHEDAEAFFLVEGEAPVSGGGEVFEVNSSPSSSSTRELYLDLVKQADPDAYATLSADGLTKGTQYTGTHYFGVFQSAEGLANFFASKPEARKAATIIYSSESAKDVTEGSWGTYEMPGAQSPLRKRDQPFEAPLELDPIASLHQSANPALSALANSSSKRVEGILPACFSSESLCESMTRNCSGHGRCFHKYTDSAASTSSPARECYACQCSEQVTENENGKTVTIWWGGPACQKKDISAQFWLIALFTVGLVFTIMFAIGQLVEMGGQELPSVIGAGVSGPVKRS